MPSPLFFALLALFVIWVAASQDCAACLGVASYCPTIVDKYWKALLEEYILLRYSQTLRMCASSPPSAYSFPQFHFHYRGGKSTTRILRSGMQCPRMLFDASPPFCFPFPGSKCLRLSPCQLVCCFDAMDPARAGYVASRPYSALAAHCTSILRVLEPMVSMIIFLSHMPAGWIAVIV